VGPSALDWLLLGDDGTIEDPDEVIQKLNATDIQPGRTHWGVSVLQAIEEFDAGPVWAFEQFAIDIDEPRLTKSALYRGAVSHAAMTATMTAISRVSFMAGLSARTWPSGTRVISPSLKADPRYSSLSVDENKPFQGGRLHNRPLLKAASREFDTDRHTARQVSRRIRSGDSQPGVLSKCFGASLYVYGGLIEENAEKRVPVSLVKMPSKILGVRNQAVCLSTCDGKGVWITHARRMKTKNDKALWPKVPATSALVALGLVTAEDVRLYDWAPVPDWKFSESQTFQEVWVNMDVDKDAIKTAYVYFDFYNGAMATDQCLHLLQALQYVLSQSTPESPVQAVVMMGGAYFGNGIALNVIEAADDPSMESWLNINGIDDVVHCLLHELPARGIVTIAAIRGNAAAGGVALAAACDIVIAGSNVVLNPAYRAIGLFGSE
jgi:methionyl-tRNA formyltransferase